MIGVKNSYESIDTMRISDELLIRLFEIEQDMWSRGIGEYVRCDGCDLVFSKKDIYGIGGSHELEKNIQVETVMKIEDLLGGVPSCKCCGGKTEHVFEKDDYIPEMRKRYGEKESFLTIARNHNGEVIGFMDAYISTLEEIFENEFKFHFSEELMNELMERYKIHRQQRLLTFSSLGTDDKNKSLLTILSLIKKFFTSMEGEHDMIPGIFESIIGSSTYCIFSIMGANRMGANKDEHLSLLQGRNSHYQTDILFQRGIVDRYKQKFNVRSREVVKYSRQIEFEGVYA